MEHILYEVKKIVVGQDHFLERVMVAMLRALPDLVWLVPVLPLLAAVAVSLRVLLGRAQGDLHRVILLR